MTVALDSKQLSVLDKNADKFIAAGFQIRERMIKIFLQRFGSAWPPGTPYIKAEVETVSVLSAVLGCSQTLSSLFASIFMPN
jgi:hypothetical protein